MAFMYWKFRESMHLGTGKSQNLRHLCIGKSEFDGIHVLKSLKINAFRYWKILDFKAFMYCEI